MVATVIINEKNGAGETATAKTSGTVRFKNADNATVDTVAPLVIPTSNREYSYEKWLRLEITGGTFTNVSNVNFYTDGANGYEGASGFVKLWAAADATYSTPVIPTETNDPPQQSAVAMTNAFTYTSGSPLSLGAGPYSSAAEIGSYVVLVMEVETAATTSGASGDETLTFSYDEV
jgi:hypothetical protein